jgi:hypothetical protein
MTPQYILKKSLGRVPHCWYSCLPGQGYVGTRHTDPEFQNKYQREALSAIENLNWSTEYAEPGYTDPAKGILLANWNVFSQRVAKILEGYGYAIEWEDEWATCSCCNKAFRISPDSYYWTPSYKIEDGEVFCLECATEDEEEEDA